MAEKIRVILNDLGQSRRMSEKGFDYVEKHYGEKAFYHQLKNIYEQAINISKQTK